MARQYRQKEYVDDGFVDALDLIQIDEYKDIKLNRYYFDRVNKRILLYMPLKNRYQVVQPFAIKTNKNRNKAFTLIPAFSTKSKTLSYDKFIDYVLQKYDVESSTDDAEA